ncbi:MAG: cytochrome-c peroxidase [Planctomycetota bacterium]
MHARTRFRPWFCSVLVACFALAPAARAGDEEGLLNKQLSHILRRLEFTGRVEQTLEARLGRTVDHQLARIGRFLFFDTVTGLNNDNNCASCHSPTNGFGDSQSIAIGIENNGIVGPNRAGPRNQRRTPSIVNTAFFRSLMWNSRFASLANDPFDNSGGFQFPPPESQSLSQHPHLLVAQAFIPPTERVEAAGFAFPGNNDDIRAEVMNRINAVTGYRTAFGSVFPEVAAGAPITYTMFAQAIAEFEFNLVLADAPIDRFARGELDAMSKNEKRGALLFFDRAKCVQCHAVSGDSNEMFSDFEMHVAGVPQVMPRITNMVFDGPGQNEDFGLEQVTGDPNDRYKFRTSPLRNVGVQPAFFHNGAFTDLEAAIRHHLNVFQSAQSYSPAAQGLDDDLRGPLGPIDPVLARIDPLLASPIALTNEEVAALVAFVRNALLDPRAQAANLRRLIPAQVPSGLPVPQFE